MDEYVYKEADLNTNLNELAHEVIRELFVTAKKVSVYSAGHPLTQKALGRPFLLMEKVFKFKRFFNLHISSGQLYALNIKVRPSIFAEQIMEYMQILDVRDILFESGISVYELTIFLERFVKRLPSTDYQNLMTTHLEKNRIKSIYINADLGNLLFDKGRKFMGDLRADFSVRNMVGIVIGEEFSYLVDMLLSETLNPDEYIMRFNHDYHPRLLKYFIPEKISLIEADYLVSFLTDRIESHLGSTADKKTINDVILEQIRNLIAALNYHPQREEIISRISTILLGRGMPGETLSEILPQPSAIRVESSEKIDQFLNAIFSRESFGYTMADFEEYYGKLLRTGQQGKARAVIDLLLEHLAKADLDLRRNALTLLELAFTSCHSLTGAFLLEHLISKIDEFISSNRETFEFSELIWTISQICLNDKKYDELSSLCLVLSKKATHTGGTLIYNSLAVKKAVSELNQREIINQLIWEMVEGRSTDFHNIKNILVTIGTEEVAFALASIISHDSRQIRQYALRILSELGKASLNVFTKIMEDNANFEREEGKRELPDAQWYVIRNSIFVLGALRDPDGCRALRLRLTDDDTRVRRAIVSALEKIGGEQAVDLLLVMASDPDKEIVESTIIALGIIGQADIVPELIDIAFKHNSKAVQIILILGKMGGKEARQFLCNLLTDGQLQAKLTSNRSSRDELRLATIKALGKIGDTESLEKLRGFNDSLSASQKIFFGAGKLNKAAEDILNRLDK
ncbi:MAG: HEAT repeat domain-containing protein [candidate division Zixibacteria bacterium]|nr:HEAT repeat domain-containing protein [candidate division Zixibacteria bacterium]